MISINDFEFEYSGNGHYIVSYISPITYKKYVKLIDNMRIIDNTKNEGAFAKKKDLNDLKRLIKNK